MGERESKRVGAHKQVWDSRDFQKPDEAAAAAEKKLLEHRAAMLNVQVGKPGGKEEKWRSVFVNLSGIKIALYKKMAVRHEPLSRAISLQS
jgi:hypothetical protein